MWMIRNGKEKTIEVSHASGATQDAGYPLSSCLWGLMLEGKVEKYQSTYLDSRQIFSLKLLTEAGPAGPPPTPVPTSSIECIPNRHTVAVRDRSSGRMRLIFLIFARKLMRSFIFCSKIFVNFRANAPKSARKKSRTHWRPVTARQGVRDWCSWWFSR